MDDKKFQNAIDILLQQMATTHAEGQETKEKQTEHEKRINRLERATINLYNASVEHGKLLAEQSKEIAQVNDSIKEMREAQREAHKDMDERLNAVIFMAEKFFSGQNGKSKK